MKNKSKILLALILSIIVISFLGKERIGLFIDKMNITKNSFTVNVDEEISLEDLYIYWIGETEYTDGEVKNKILIYHHKIQSDIPDSYGKNWFLVKYKNEECDKMGILKLYSYAKHDYKFDLKIQNENIIINWKITNWYSPDIYQGTNVLKRY